MGCCGNSKPNTTSTSSESGKPVSQCESPVNYKEAIVNIKNTCGYLMLGALLAVLHPLRGRAQENSSAATTSAKQAAKRDGQHDFDFELGSWKIHLKRLLHPLTGSTTWAEFDGTSVTRKVWDGRSQLEEFETDSPAGGHIEGMHLRLHHLLTHQWSLYWENSK